jgi:hypothetical protein
MPEPLFSCFARSLLCPYGSSPLFCREAKRILPLKLRRNWSAVWPKPNRSFAYFMTLAPAGFPKGRALEQTRERVRARKRESLQARDNDDLNPTSPTSLKIPCPSCRKAALRRPLLLSRPSTSSRERRHRGLDSARVAAPEAPHEGRLFFMHRSALPGKQKRNQRERIPPILRARVALIPRQRFFRFADNSGAIAKSLEPSGTPRPGI